MVCAMSQRVHSATYHFIKDISLVDMNSNKSLISCSLHFRQFSCCYINQLIQHIHEICVSLCHDLKHKMYLL